MKLRRSSAVLPLVLALLLTVHGVRADEPVRPIRFFGTGTSSAVLPPSADPAVPRPDSVLGFPLGEKPARHAQVLEYFRVLERTSGRVRVFTMGQTYEGRPLIYAVIADEAVLARLEEVRADLARLADPRSLSARDAAALIARTPVAAWMAYSIHGDEISGVDASLAVAYRLAAGTDSLTRALRANVLTIIDPNQNPDGRERYLAQMEAFSSAVPHADGQSFQKGGFWPWGRGNHYLFDMNRDWFTLALTETKARVAAVTRWHPQLVVDAHEMGQWDTYLFSPPRAPFNLSLTADLLRWWDVFAADHARAFDARGWAYYTRDWNEEWYPGYGSSWPLYTGAVGILYEQAGITGRIARRDGTIMTYGESVEHHIVSSLANLTTALRNRTALLEHYVGHRRTAVEEFGGGPAKTYLAAAGGNVDRLEELADILTRQEIEVRVATAPFTAGVRGYYDGAAVERTFPAGSLIIPADQPQGFLVQTILGFDPRLPDSFLAVERRELLKNRDSKLYEVTSWSLFQAFGVDGYSADRSVAPPSRPWTPAVPTGSLERGPAPQGWLMDVTGDRGARALALLLERGFSLQAAEKPLDWGGRPFPRGSVYVPARANSPALERVLDSIAAATGVNARAVSSGKGGIGPDVGASHLVQLRRPRIALVAGGMTSSTSVGWIWHLLDQRVGVPVSLVDVAQLGGVDLSVYNVLILPDGGGLSSALGRGARERIRAWITAGGTLVAMGSSAAFCADSANGFSSVRTRDQVLTRLAEYDAAALEEIAAEKPDIRSLQLWDYTEKDTTGARPEQKPLSPEETRKAEETGRLFAPHGAILRVDLDPDHWLTAGMGDRVPVMVTNGVVLLGKFPAARTVGRYAAPSQLRISGLLWPEARLRMARTAYATVEQSGSGQIILFATQPNFRALFRGSERLLINALLYGPGMGTSRTPAW